MQSAEAQAKSAEKALLESLDAEEDRKERDQKRREKRRNKERTKRRESKQNSSNCATAANEEGSSEATVVAAEPEPTQREDEADSADSSSARASTGNSPLLAPQALMLDDGCVDAAKERLLLGLVYGQNLEPKTSASSRRNGTGGQ